MLLFIFESIGTPELIVIGLAALIFLGPRRIPEFARKAGKIMSDLRNATNDFKETWEREVNFEDEAKAFDLDAIEAESVAREKIEIKKESNEPSAALPEPSIREVDAAEFQNAPLIKSPSAEDDDKSNWL